VGRCAGAADEAENFVGEEAQPAACHDRRS
jgi:hypothetical protein